ncbi:NRDE family protein [Aliivibrio sp. SR45-2]|uniref:NRDE family protein n=1 Tax=Aliivibrio sp. SR45-2 TaxID=2760931 RepID=UPI0015F800E3|nr:NRDE family protein [Aliivibrio sp. SR45-2]MBB1314443.1 NRDE family protein [Aliivibrio sp. SR45-2]
MCTVSWFTTPTGYELFFNRDEQRSRSDALTPQVFQENNVDYIMPIDPVGGGSWISLNNHGISICLLNYYQGSTPPHNALSRGLLIKELATCHHIDSIQHVLSKMDFSRFASFTLLIFHSTASNENNTVKGFRWDGQSFDSITPSSPMISSSVDAKSVIKHRLSVYKELTDSGVNRQTLSTFHQHHHAKLGHRSPCMHRQDAQTVSFTHIIVDNENNTLRYFSGSPCQTKKYLAYDVPFHSYNNTHSYS